MQQREKISFLVEFINSIKEFDSYHKFASEKVSKSILYITKIVVIFSVIISSIFIFKFLCFRKNVLNVLNEQIEEIKYENEKIYIKSKDDKISINDNFINIRILINTNDINEEELLKYEQQVRNGEISYVILRESIIGKSPINDEIEKYSYNLLSNVRNN